MNNRPILNYALIIVLILSMGIEGLALESLAVHDIVYRKKELSSQKLAQLQWLPQSHYFSYINKDETLVVAGINNNITKFLSLDILNSHLGANFITFPQISWIDENRFWLKHEQNIVIYDTNSTLFELANTLESNAENITAFSPYLIAYTVGPNLFLSHNNSIIALTNNSPSTNIVSGHSVHRQEFEDKGIFWSPDGKALAYYRMDESMVDNYPFEDFKSYPVKIDYIKYPMAGRQNHEVKLIIYKLESQEHVTLDTQVPLDHYLANLSWSSNSEHIFLNILNRAQNHLRTYSFDASNSQGQELIFEHKAQRYIKPSFSFYSTPQFPQENFWCSPHQDWFQLYKLNIENKMLSLLTPQHKDISECIGFKGFGEKFFYSAFSTDKPSRLGYCYDRQSETSRVLTKNQEGMHQIIPSDDGQFVLDVFSSTRVPYQVDLIDTEGTFLQTIYQAPDPLAAYEQGHIELIKLRSANDKYDLFGRIIFPPGFCATNSYPAIIYVYGGPGVQIVQESFGAPLWQTMMAQKGYIVFSLDNRGSANRGQDFEKETFHALGKEEVLDQMKGIEYLRSLNYVDMTKLGVHGWSFGGYMTIALMLKNPGVFKAGLAGGGVIDWKNYESPYTERYMGHPLENPEGYEESNLLNFVDKLSDDLMVITGTHDDVVVPRHTKLLIAKAIECGKRIDTFFYPYGKHHFDIQSEFHLYDKMTTYFDEKLRTKS